MGQAEAYYGDDEVDADHDELDHPDGDEVAFLPLLDLRCHGGYVSVREKMRVEDRDPLCRAGSAMVNDRLLRFCFVLMKRDSCVVQKSISPT